MEQKINVVVLNNEGFTKVQFNNELEAFQSIVDGYIEVVYPFDDRQIVMICNEEGKFRAYYPTMILGDDVIMGNVIFCNVDEEGNFSSLTEEEMEFVMNNITLYGEDYEEE